MLFKTQNLATPTANSLTDQELSPTAAQFDRIKVLADYLQKIRSALSFKHQNKFCLFTYSTVLL